MRHFFLASRQSRSRVFSPCFRPTGSRGQALGRGAPRARCLGGPHRRGRGRRPPRGFPRPPGAPGPRERVLEVTARYCERIEEGTFTVCTALLHKNYGGENKENAISEPSTFGPFEIREEVAKAAGANWRILSICSDGASPASCQAARPHGGRGEVAILEQDSWSHGLRTQAAWSPRATARGGVPAVDSSLGKLQG